jgi:WD40 repeat protein
MTELRAYRYLANAHYYLENIDSAIYFLNVGLSYASRHNINNEDHLKIFINKAQIFENYKLYDDALRLYKESLEFAYSRNFVLSDSSLLKTIEAGILNSKGRFKIRMPSEKKALDQAEIENAYTEQNLLNEEINTNCPKFNTGHTDWIISSLVSGDRLYSGSFNGYIKLWDKKSRKELKELFLEKTSVDVLYQFSNDTIIIGFGNGRIAVVDKNLKIYDLMINQNAAIEDIKKINDSTFIVVQDNMFAHIWNIKSRQVVKSLVGNFDAFSQAIITEKKLVTFGQNNLLLWDLENYNLLHKREAHSDNIKSMTVDIDQKIVVTCSMDKTVKLWSLNDLLELGTLVGHKSDVHKVGISKDNKYIVSVGFDGKIIVWDAIKQLNREEFYFENKEFTDILFTDNFCLVSDNQGWIHKIDLERCKLIKSSKIHNAFIKKIDLISANEIVSTSFDKSMKILSLIDLRIIHTYCGLNGTETFDLGQEVIPLWALKKKIKYDSREHRIALVGYNNSIVNFSIDSPNEDYTDSRNDSIISYDFIFINSNDSIAMCNQNGELLLNFSGLLTMKKLSSSILKKIVKLKNSNKIVALDHSGIIYYYDFKKDKSFAIRNYSKVHFLDLINVGDDKVLILATNGFIILDENGNCLQKHLMNQKQLLKEREFEISVNQSKSFLAMHELKSDDIEIFNLLSNQQYNITWDEYEILSIEWFPGDILYITDKFNQSYLVSLSGEKRKTAHYEVSQVVELNEKTLAICGKELMEIDSSFNATVLYEDDNNITDFVYDKNLEIFILADDNYTSTILRKNYESLYTRTSLPKGNYFVKLPNSPYYMCSKDASKMLHYVTPSLKVIGFEQLDPVYNRPDIVLDSIGKYFGGADHEMVANYRQSWEKRIDRLGLDKEKLGKGEIAVPNAEIVGADDITYENKEGKLNIKVSANDPKYPLSRFNVYINEVPLYGSAGISIAHLKKQVWDTTVSVALSVGENKIQVSVMNELGLENFKYPTYVNYTPEKDIVAKTHYIGIGVNAFKDSSHNLKYCKKDVEDLANSFSGPNTEVKLFTDQQVTKENILALKDYLKKISVNDKVIISCSSHGLLDDSLNFYLAMHDVDFNNPKARGLKYEELESLLDGIPARQKLLLLDACNSGENDKTELLKQDLQQKENNMDSTQVLAARGVIIKLEEENKSNFKKMNELFVNVRNNTGSVIISAAGGQESALEAIKVDGKTIENGAFTYSILECIKQNEGKELKVNTLKQYAEKRVEEITNGKQKPTSRQETMEVDWGVR